MSQLDEAIEKLREALGCEFNLSLRHAIVLELTHNVLDLLAKMDSVCFLSYCWTGGHCTWELQGSPQTSSFRGELPQAVLAAVTSEEFKEWQKRRKQ